MSPGAKNCPFLTFTARPVAAAARSRSVWRQRKAGICSSSHTCPAARACSGRWMSVVTGSPVVTRTFSRTASPASIPKPRKAPPLVRLALSNEALNTTWIGSRSASPAKASAISRQSRSESITQGPAITRSGQPGPQDNSPISAGRRGITGELQRAFLSQGNGAHTPTSRRLNNNWRAATPPHHNALRAPRGKGASGCAC